MATLGNYYYDGTSFALATGLFTNSSLSVVAPDGWYSQGGIYRKMTGGVLGATNTCPSCITSCGSTPVSQNVFAKSLLTVDVGVNVGAVIVEFTVGAGNNARATWTYNAITASEYSSPNTPGGGYLQGLIGDQGCCGATNMTGSGGTTYTGAEQSYSGGVWQPNGNVSTWGPYLNQAAGGVTLNSFGGWGTTIMVVPKTSAVLNTIDFVIDSPNAGTFDWSIKVLCPAYLPSFQGTLSSQGDCATACSITTSPDLFYHAPVSGATGLPAVNDWVFTDSSGVTAVADGYYSVFFGGVFSCMETANGVIINLTSC